MSKVNFNRNVFLEKEELVNFQSFFLNSLFGKMIVQASYSFGMVTNDPSKINNENIVEVGNVPFNDPFRVELGTNVGSIKVLPGLALTSNGQIISIDLVDNIQVPSDGIYYWVKIAYKERYTELGTVGVNSQGILSGTVDFSGKIRGQATSTPVMVRFEKEGGTIPLNNQNYQVVSVIDKNNLMLTSATSFSPESELKVIVLGTLPVGGTFSDEQLKGIYTYDHYEISLISETSVNTPPAKTTGEENNEFYIARVVNNSNVVVPDNTVKSEYWSLGNQK